MGDVPETVYTQGGVIEVAYQVIGEGDRCVFYLPPAHVPIDLVWDEPHARRFLERLASLGRLVLFDPRGWAASSGTVTPGVPTAEDWADDVGLVMDAAGVERAVLVGQAEGAFCSVYFAAAHPERVDALVMANAFARYVRSDDYPIGLPVHLVDPFAEEIGRHYGTGWSADVLVPSLASEPGFKQWWARCERMSTSPSALRTYWAELVRRDVRSVLPALRVPTLVLHRRGDRYVPVAHGRYLAEHIEGARYVELDGDDSFLFAGDADAIVDEIEDFVTGTRPVQHIDRVLATVLFTDIVNSTSRAAEVGDAAWRRLLDSHDDAAARLVARHRGKLVKSTGDGILATFDGPSRAVDCAVALREAVSRLGIEIRAGLHAGEVERRGDDIGGLAVHIASRVQALARGSEILVSRTVTDLVAGSGLTFTTHGDHELKGVPGSWQLYAVAS